MKALAAALFSIFALTHLSYTQTTDVDRIVLEGSCLQRSGGAAAGTACTYSNVTITGSLWPTGYDVRSAGRVQFVDADNVRAIGPEVEGQDLLSTFTWRTWLMLALLLASLAVFYRETRGMIGMAFMRPSLNQDGDKP